MCEISSQSPSVRALLHCALAAAQCIVIGPVCLWLSGWLGMCVCVFVCGGGGGVGVGSVTTITRNCVNRSSPNWVFR